MYLSPSILSIIIWGNKITWYNDSKWTYKNIKRITKKAWFGKKIIGWGIRPVSLEGWLIPIVFTIAIIVDQIHNKRSITGYFILAVIRIIFLLLFT